MTPRYERAASSYLKSRQPITYAAGPFTVRLITEVTTVQELLQWCYGPAVGPSSDVFVDYNIGVVRASGTRRWLRPQVKFTLEDTAPFEPYPADHAFPLLEWGFNWCIATRAHQYLMLHSAVVARGGRTLILPALPGSGKTTLCAGLIQCGWRLLSDEFGLVDHRSGIMQPLPRALPLKNRSIDVIAERGSTDEIGPRFEKTRKGTVAHLRPPRDSLRRQHETSRPGWIVFPRYIAGHPTRVRPIDQSVAFTRLAQNSFNYRMLGGTGFRRLCRLILDCPCYSMEYSDLDDALSILDDLTGTSADADG